MQSDCGYFEETKLGKPYDLNLLKRIYPFTSPMDPNSKRL